MVERDIDRLQLRLSGVRNMKELPGLIFVIDVPREATAIHEANRKNSPVVGMVDTNCDPRNVDYVIPSNDDAIRAIKLVVGKIADAAIEGKMMRDGGETVSVEFSADTNAAAAGRLAADDSDTKDEDLFGASTLEKINSKAAEAAE